MNPNRPVRWEITAYFTEGTKEWKKTTEPLTAARVHLLRALATLTEAQDELVHLQVSIRWQGRRGTSEVSIDRGGEGPELVNELDIAIYGLR